MIKKFATLFLVLLTAFRSWTQTPAEWQADLRHLQKTVHEKYSNLFHTITAADWDKAVEKFHGEIPSLNKMQTLAGFIRMVSLFNIGHTQVATWGFHQPSSAAIKLSRYPYRLYWFSDGLYIQSADKQYEKAVGGRILKIGNMKTDDAIAAIRPLVSYENEQGFKSNSIFFLANPQFMQVQGITNTDQEVSMLISKDGKEQTVTFKSVDNTPPSATGIELPENWVAGRKTDITPLWQKDAGKFRYFEYLPSSKTVFVRHSVTQNDGPSTITAFFKKVFDFIDNNEVERLVLDVRLNGGGNNYLNKDIITGIIASRKINQPGKFFCIIGRRTFSAAQNLVNELERYTEVIFAGEPTSENVNFYGDTKTEVLPNSKLPVNLSWMWWQNLDPRDKRKATSPRLAADMSFADYYNNNDPALNAVMAYDPSQTLINKLTTLLKAGKKEEALKFARDYLADPLHRYFLDRVEPEINNEGYRLMQNGNKDLASHILEVNVKTFPESANAYDSYAESLMELGKNEEALKFYQVAIEKDKKGETAENSRKMIEKLKEKKGF